MNNLLTCNDYTNDQSEITGMVSLRFDSLTISFVHSPRNGAQPTTSEAKAALKLWAIIW